MSQDNIAAEAAQHENGLMFSQPNAQSNTNARSSVKNSLMSLYQEEEAARLAGRSAIRRLSTQVKSFVLNKNSRPPVYPREATGRRSTLAASLIGLTASNASNNLTTQKSADKQ